MTRTDRGGTTTGARGQTTLDFAVGVSVFLLTAIFVLTFVPGMLEPFEESTQEEISAADRIATELVEETLASPERPNLLDRECTVIFFETNGQFADAGENTDGDGDYGDPFGGSDGYSAPCNFQDLAIGPRLATDISRLNVRISLQRDLTTGESDSPDEDSDDIDDGDTNDDEPDSLCLDANNPRIVEADRPLGGACDPESSVDDDVLFEIGPTPPTGSESVVVARRFVRFEGGFADGTNDATLVVEVW